MVKLSILLPFSRRRCLVMVAALLTQCQSRCHRHFCFITVINIFSSETWTSLSSVIHNSEEGEEDSSEDEEFCNQVQNTLQAMPVERPSNKAKSVRTTKATSVRKVKSVIQANTQIICALFWPFLEPLNHTKHHFNHFCWFKKGSYLMKYAPRQAPRARGLLPWVNFSKRKVELNWVTESMWQVTQTLEWQEKWLDGNWGPSPLTLWFFIFLRRYGRLPTCCPPPHNISYTIRYK